ncbi:MAG: hypothetical protein AMJ45_03425 [Syntrophobacter sp. DG_60]|nr:MAG: hypothetical protein AMJ45_03425 [Syntrophobacter sp. DG_60]
MAERLKIMYAETAFKTSFFASVFMHLIIFTLVSFISPQIKHIRFSPIYQVKLVSLPVSRAKPQILKKGGERVAVKKAEAKKKAIPLVKANKSKVNKKNKIDIDKDVDKLVQAKVKQIEGRLAKERVEKAVARVGAKLKGSAVSVGAYQGEVSDGLSLRFQIYYQEIWEKIKNNWILPTFLLKDATEAIVVIKIAKNGDIIDKFFEKKSGIPLFDDSVMEAISRSTPLPPIPEGYVLSYHELGIRFKWEKEK